MSKVIEFLKGTGADSHGRTLAEVLRLSDGELEHSHDIVQWLFPLNEASQCQPQSPVLTAEDVALMKADKNIQNNILEAYNRFTLFYNDPQWLTPHNHNYLRLTRILKCLGLAGLNGEKTILKKVLNAVYLQHEKAIGPVTKRFWDEA
jgi:hypothetical protein